MSKTRSDSNAKGKDIENIVIKFFSKLLKEVEVNLVKYKPSFKSIDQIEFIDVQAGGVQDGKDKVLIISIITEGGNFIKIPVFIECKGHEITNADPNKLELYKKFGQIQCSSGADKYLNTNEFIGTSYMVFMPFTHINKTDYTNTVTKYTSYDYLDFPDYYWEISNNKNRDKEIFSFDEEICKDLIDTNRFTKSLSLLDYKENQDLKDYLGKEIARHLISAYDNHIKNFNRTNNLLSQINFNDQELIKRNLAAKKKVEIGDVVIDIDECKSSYQKDLDIADGYIYDYLVRYLHIEVNGGAFADKLPEIENVFWDLFQRTKRVFSEYNNFEELEKRIMELVQASLYIFAEFDGDLGLVQKYLLRDEPTKLGCFYQKIADGEAKIELYKNYLKLDNI